MVPTLSPPEIDAVRVPPSPESRATWVVPVPAMSLTVVVVPSTSICPSVPFTVEPLERPRVPSADPPLTWSSAVLPCCVVAMERSPLELTEALRRAARALRDRLGQLRWRVGAAAGDGDGERGSR